MIRNRNVPISLCAGLAVAICLFQTSGVSAGADIWTSTGPVDDTALALAIDPLTPTVLYAGTKMNGVYESLDGGNTWNPSNTGLTTLHVEALALDSTATGTLYAGTYGGGVFKTIDGGANWIPVNAGLASMLVFTVEIDPTAPTILYAGLNAEGVQKSIDGGANWIPAGAGISGLFVYDLAIDPSTPSTVYATAGADGVYKSTDGGTNWYPANTGLPAVSINTITVDPGNPATLYAGTYGEGVYRSTDSGGNWSAINNGLTATTLSSLEVHPSNSATLFAGTWAGTWASVDGGDSWHMFREGMPTNARVFSMVFHPADPTIVHAGVNVGITGGGVYSIQSTDPGAFTKSDPGDGSSPASGPTLSWTESTGVLQYEYCYDTSDDEACNDSWISVGSSTNAVLNGLQAGTTYYWQVRAVNPAAGIEADGGSWWSFRYTPQTFADVPVDYWAWVHIERLFAAGITGGCGGGNFCPGTVVTRAQMAVFLERGMQGSSYTPPPASGTVFGDVTTGTWGAAWIEQLFADGITSGCGGGNYCPATAVTRAQMAVFLLRAKHGSAYAPPSASGTVFGDVTTGTWGAAWIEQLNAEGITGGCGGGNYCPSQSVTRASMAVLLVRTFDLP